MNTNALELHRDQRIAAGLWVWFACGCVALLLVPGQRGRDPTFGWLAYWCVLAPLIDLLVLHRSRWLAATAVFLRSSMTAKVKKRTSMRSLLEKRGYYRGKSCARRVKAHRRQPLRRRALLAALFNP